jgi:ribosomal protein L37AE/L43A
MAFGQTLERIGVVLLLCVIPWGFLVIPANTFDLMDPQAAFATFIFGGMFLGLIAFLFMVLGTALQMGDSGVASIPDEELTPAQQLRKQELLNEKREQQRESAEAAAQFFFGGSGGGSDSGGLLGGSSGTKNERDSGSMTDHLRQTKNKYSGKYLRSPKCPNCGSQATAGVGDDENVFQCDKCGNIFEARAQTRRDVNLDIENE